MEAPRHTSSSRALTLDTQAARRASAAACSSSCKACSSPATSSSSSAPRSGILGRNVGHEDSGGQAPRTVSCRERGPSEGGRQHRRQLPSLRDGGTGGMPTPGHTASCMATFTQAGLGAREAQKPVFWKAADPSEVRAPQELGRVGPMDMWKEPQTQSCRPECKAGCRPGWCVAPSLLFLSSGKREDAPPQPRAAMVKAREGGHPSFLTIHCQKTSSLHRHSRAASSRAFSLCSLRSSCNANHKPGLSEARLHWATSVETPPIAPTPPCSTRQPHLHAPPGMSSLGTPYTGPHC